MKKRLLSLLPVLLLLVSLLPGCAKPTEKPAEATAAPVVTEVPPTEAPAATEAPPTEPAETEAPTAEPAEPSMLQGYRYADHEEAADLLLSERNYYEHLNQNDLNYRMQKLDATLEELEAFARTQTLDFTDAEKAAIDAAMQAIQKTCEERGYRLPPLTDVVLAKTTMHEECDAGAYTHGTHIFLGESIVAYALYEDSNMQMYFRMILAHELFHCLTRNNPDFRKDLYELFGFTVADEDFALPPAITDAIISNPDVGHHDSYAAFEINGERKDCVVVFTAGLFEKPGDSFFHSMQTCLVPIDTLDELIPSEQAANFWDVFGKNTGYVIDPEETLADNFGMLIAYGTGLNYPTPELIEAIDAYLKQR